MCINTYEYNSLDQLVNQIYVPIHNLYVDHKSKFLTIHGVLDDT